MYANQKIDSNYCSNCRAKMRKELKKMKNKCGWKNCKFNKNGICNENVYIVSIHNPNYELIYNKNSEEIKKNCRCLTPDLGQYVERT